MKKIIILAAVAFALAACNNDDNYIDEPVAVQISAIIGNSSVTRASDTSWDPGDKIGVTMDERYVNMKYTTVNADGIFAGTTMYFKDKREPVTLTAYYPFEGTEGKSPATIKRSTIADNQTEANQQKIDFLYACRENVTGSEPKVKFSFSHKMSKLTFIFKNGSGADVSKIVSYQIEGLVLDGTFNTITGDCVANSGDAKSLDVVLNDVEVKDGTVLSSLIIFPQTTENKTIRLKISDSEGQKYACELRFKDNKINSGNNYQWTIAVNRTSLIIDESTIIEWNSEELETDAESVLS